MPGGKTDFALATAPDEASTARFLSELDNRLAAEPVVDAGALAELFNLAAGAGPLQGPLTAVLQGFLLRRTLAHARAHTRYYGSRAEYDCALTTELGVWTSLADLPTINRQTVVRHFAEFIADDVHLRSVCHTSGTTGQPLEVYKSFEEVYFIGEFFSRMFAEALRQLPLLPLTLSFPTAHHGVPIPIPGPGIGFASGVTDDTLIRDAVRVLETEYHVAGHEPRISILSGMAFQVLFFTSYLLEQQIEPKKFGLKAVNIAGGFVPAHWRRFLERSWDAPVNDRFSLTESAAGASRCRTCQWFMPDPHQVMEVLDCDTGRVLDEGIGRLIVTNLHPFVQMQPLIRYETGDVVECRRCFCSPLQKIRFLGREKNSISRMRSGERRWLVFSAELHEVLATIPDLRIYDWFSNVRVARDRTVGSLPIMSLKTEPAEGRLRIVLSAELKYAPHCYPDRLAELTAMIRRHLESVEGTTFAEDLASGEVEFDCRFVPPEALTDPYVIKV